VSVLDSWFTGVQTAATSAATAIAGALGAWLALRKKVGTDSSELGLMKALQTERDTYKKEWMESFSRRLKDQEEIGRLKGLNEDLQLRANELLEQEMYHQQKIGACDEKVRGLSERIKTLQIENRDLFAEVARLAPEAAQRLTEKRFPPDTPPEQLV
jgi:chromosome segregation ATPase